MTLQDRIIEHLKKRGGWRSSSQIADAASHVGYRRDRIFQALKSIENNVHYVASFWDTETRSMKYQWHDPNDPDVVLARKQCEWFDSL